MSLNGALVISARTLPKLVEPASLIPPWRGLSHAVATIRAHLMKQPDAKRYPINDRFIAACKVADIALAIHAWAQDAQYPRPDQPHSQHQEADQRGKAKDARVEVNHRCQALDQAEHQYEPADQPQAG